MKNIRRTRKGLILLVVLGMLSLFSLLAVSYMVVSSQSRSANFGRARQDFRGTDPAKLLDEAIRQVVRGSNDTQSVLWRNSLLGDLYGNAVRGSQSTSGNSTSQFENSDGAKTIRARRRTGTTAADVRRDFVPRRATMTTMNWLPNAAQMLYANIGSPEAPQILGGRFLRIPLDWDFDLPRQHDAWNGRVVTFMQGPLQGESFRVLRYIGEVERLDEIPTTGATPAPIQRPGHLVERASQYSITIDLAKVQQRYITIGGTRFDFASWVASNTSGAALCYADDFVSSGGSFTSYSAYNMHLNSGEQNSYGPGFRSPSVSQTMGNFAAIPALNHLAAPNNLFPPDSSTQVYRSLAVNLAFNWAHIARANGNITGYGLITPGTGTTPPVFGLLGDADESYDAADQNNPALAFIHPSGSTNPSDNIIPSFHRPALVNHIYQRVNSANPIRGTSFELIDLISTIELIQRACGRPLSWRIDNVPPGVSASGVLANNPGFDGSNDGEYSTSTYVGTPQLVINWAQWGDTNQSEQDSFENWIRWLTRGPYDVDTDGNGFAESVWTDINLPLMTSREGKLLKALAAFYIEDLGGRIDINRSGSLQQALAGHDDFTADSAISFRPNNQLPQGLGFDTADISLRHLFGGDVDLTVPLDVNDIEHLNFMRSRYAPAGTLNASMMNYWPGDQSNDLRSLWAERNLAAVTNPFSLPGFPMSRVGRAGISVDLLGNPVLYEEALAANHANQVVNDPYELGRLDSPYTIAEWERLERLSDPDRTHLPRRLEDWVFTATTPVGEREPLDRRNVGRALSPRNIAMQFPRSAQTYTTRYEFPATGANPAFTQDENHRVTTFTELVEAMSQQRWALNAAETLPRHSRSVVAQLFPLEFKQNLPLDLNRPFGNGFDDDGDGQIDEADELASHGLDDTDDGMGNTQFGVDDDGDGVIDNRHEVDESAEFARATHQRATNINATGTGLVETGIVDATTFTGEVAPEDVTDLSILYSNPESQLTSNAAGQPNVGLYDPGFRDFVNDAATSITNNNDRRLAIRQFNGDQSRQLLARHLYCLAQLILPDTYVFANSDGTAHAYGTLQRARFLAQWAVNVVDFRDADHNMTRFCFDPDPFGRSGGTLGWEPDPDLVVFGHESPDLLITESFAFHDSRISPNVQPIRPGSQQREFVRDVWRQIRLPEGSLFLEFFCPRGTVDNAQAISRPVGSTGNRQYWNATGGLNLSMVTPADYAGVSYPVWRLMMTAPQAVGNTLFDQYKDPTQRINLSYQTAEPAGQMWNGSPGNNPIFDRVVWFTNDLLTPSTNNLCEPDNSNFTLNSLFRMPGWTNPMTPDNRSLSIPRGQYLVVGPRAETFIGQQQPRNPDAMAPLDEDILPDSGLSYPQLWQPSEQSIELSGQVTLNGFGATSVTAPASSVAILQSHNAVTGAGWTGFHSGLSVSEPFPNAYYEPPTDYISNAPMTGFPNRDGYVNRSADAFASSSVDVQDITVGPLASGWETDDEGTGNPVRPKFQTRLNWSNVVLQRLANPDRPWHEELNPYITQDWMPIDLTVFSGEVSDFEVADALNHHRIRSIRRPDLANQDDSNTPENEQMPVDDPATMAIDESIPTFRFNSRQKTGAAVGIAQSIDLSAITLGSATMTTFGDVPLRAGRTFFSYHTENPYTNDWVDQTTNFDFEWAFQTNLNQARLSFNSTGSVYEHSARWMTLGDLNSRFGLLGAETTTPAVPAYPRAPLNVVRSGANDLEFAPSAPVVLNRDFVNSYELLSVLASAPGRMMQEFTAENPGMAAVDTHLMDFEMSRGANGSLSAAEKSGGAFFELVDVRNAWADTVEMLNPAVAGYERSLRTTGTGAISLADQMRHVVMSPYRAPFNRIPTYVQPGRINLNTIANPASYRALMWNAITPRSSRNAAGATLYETELNDVRRRYTSATALPLGNPHLADAFANQFPGALRSPFSAAVAPITTMQLQNSIDATLLRTDEATPQLRAVAAGAAVPHNAILQNLPVSRLKNLTSSNSHTFAVRITIGFFEFDPDSGLGREYGIDEGTATRHRGYYIIDRSIPVGYREGLDLNTERCILMRRIIE